MLTLADPLEHATRVHAERTAVIDGAARFSYADLHTRARRLAAGLRGLGAQEGDRIALLSANSHRYLEAFLGVPAYGMILVPLNTRLATPELRAIVKDAGVRFLISDRNPGGLASEVERVLSIPDDYEAILEAGDPAQVVRANDENAVAALFYTGGTTGQPKGVMLTHRNLVANAFHKAVACSLVGHDVFLASPAMFHVAGIAPLLSLVWLGGRVITQPSFEPEGCLDLIAEHGVTVVMPVPTMLVGLIEAQRRRPRDVSSLRMLGHAGSPIAAETIEAAVATFPGVELAQFYGATETASIVTCMRDEQRAVGTQLLGSCGRATPGVSVRVLRPDGSECDAQEVGEVVVRGPNVTVGYWNKPAETAAALRGGDYHTGDLGVMHRDGHLFIVDRAKDMIVTGGENVYSTEVEDVLYRHPAVLEAAVFGIPDEHWGEAVHAVVVVSTSDAARGDALVSELRAQCRTAIAGYKVPKRIDLQCEPLPKSGPGKVLKRVLREPFWQEVPQGRRI